MSDSTPGDERQRWLEHNREIWSSRAAGWSRMLDEDPDGRATQLRRSAQALTVGPGTRLLDAGSGTGHWAVGFATVGASVTAIDLSPAMLALTRQRAAEHGVALTLREGDIVAQLAADPAATYDAIHCQCVLQFTPDLLATLRAFRRVIAPHGRLLAAVPGALSPIYSESYRRFLEPLTNNWVVPWELERLLDHEGWAIVDGWGNYARSGGGKSNAFTEPEVLALPLRLQQAAATFWTTIATPR